jgi:hypothetical protein
MWESPYCERTCVAFQHRRAACRGKAICPVDHRLGIDEEGPSEEPLRYPAGPV